MLGFTHRVAALGGAYREDGLGTWVWDLAGSCQRAKPRETVNRDYLGFHQRLILWVRCRTCSMCLHRRRLSWRDRAVFEWKDHEELGKRTWLGTFTVSDEWRFRFMWRALVEYEARGKRPHPKLARPLEWEELSEGERFSLISAQVGREITLWVKRVRKNSGAKLRYLLVCEAHDTREGDPSGLSQFPHFHIMLHENEGMVVKNKFLKPEDDESWSWERPAIRTWGEFGFTKWKLVKDAKGAAYASKYLGKSMLARVRASLGYGKTPSSDIAPARRVMTTAPLTTPPPDIQECLVTEIFRPMRRAARAARRALETALLVELRETKDGNAVSDCERESGRLSATDRLQPHHQPHPTGPPGQRSARDARAIRCASGVSWRYRFRPRWSG